MANYESEPVQRALKVLQAMVGHEARGVKPGELAKGLAISPSQVTRVLANLKQAGLAEHHPADEGYWRLTAQFAQLSNTVSNNLMRAQQQLSQDVHNYSIER